jgi:outer membrane biosynthesis protein TonB
VLFVSKKFSNSGPAQQRQPEMTIVAIQAPPPPPPPPPKPTPPPELTPPKQEMIKEDAPDDKQEKPKDETPPAPQITTGIKGPGGDSSMGTAGNGSVFGGSGKRGGSKFGWYAGPVQSRIAEALRTNKGTRGVKIESLPVRIWVDSNGAISRVELRGSTGQSGQDEAIRQALLGLRLSEPPPSDMPMPINLRLSARAGFTAQR